MAETESFAYPGGIPLGISSFASMRDFGQIYVDKTDLIFEIAKNPRSVFLTRPRKFGKSLLVSTLEELFERGIGGFDGLEISELWTDKTYPVLSLNFSTLKARSLPEFRAHFNNYLKTVFRSKGLAYYPEESYLNNFQLWLAEHAACRERVVLLIDDYDAPLGEVLDNREVFSQIQAELGRFLSLLKTYNAALRFCFVTGVLNLIPSGIFSESYSLEDISFSEKYGELLGFTVPELRESFTTYLKKAASQLNLSAEGLLKKLGKEYGGYNFRLETPKPVLCPWSVLRFLSSPEDGFQKYWIQTGGSPDHLLHLLLSSPLNNPKEFDKLQGFPISNLVAPQSFPRLNSLALFTYTGYLAIQRKEASEVIVSYPNQEVRGAIGQMYSRRLVKSKSLLSLLGLELDRFLNPNSPKALIEGVNRIFAAIDFRIFPITDEGECLTLLKLIFLFLGFGLKDRESKFEGSCNLEAQIAGKNWYFEIKYALKVADEDKCLEKAVRQISDGCYGDSEIKEGEEKIALVFSKEKRCFTRWAKVLE